MPNLCPSVTCVEKIGINTLTNYKTYTCRLQGQEDAADADDFMTYVTQGLSQMKYVHENNVIQGLFELRSGSAEVALTYFDSAISLQPDDELPFIYRAQCKIKLDRPQDAILDAEEALKYNKNSTKAVTCKGEALYMMGEFEQALVQFERGYRVRQGQWCVILTKMYFSEQLYEGQDFAENWSFFLHKVNYCNVTKITRPWIGPSAEVGHGEVQGRDQAHRRRR